MSKIQLYNGDCLEVMQEMIDNGIKVDVIIADPPYGLIKESPLEGWKNSNTSWDTVIDWKRFWKLSVKLVKNGGNIVLFNQMPSALGMLSYSKHLYKHRIVWIKNNHSNPFNIKTNPYKYVEDIYVFRNNDVLNNDGSIIANNTTNPELRLYSKKLKEEWIKKTPHQISKDLGHSRAELFLRDKVKHFFSLCKEDVYNELITVYKINNWKGFIPYEELQKVKITFNSNKGETKVKDHIFINKDKNNSHPTQKPLDLMLHLCEVYSNLNDIVLDPFMGSGTTGVAAKQLNRNFIGIELDKTYFNIAKERIEND